MSTVELYCWYHSDSASVLFKSSVKPSYIHFHCVATIHAGAARQAGDADSYRAPGLTSGLQGSVNVHRGALLFVPQ